MSNYFDEFDIRVLFRLHLHHFVQHLTLFTWVHIEMQKHEMSFRSFCHLSHIVCFCDFFDIAEYTALGVCFHLRHSLGFVLFEELVILELIFILVELR